MSRTTPTLSLALLGLLVLAPAGAQDRRNPLERLRDQLRGEVRHAWQLWRTESGIERRIVAGELRGLLSRRPPAPDWTPREAAGGRLELVDGVPVLHLQGTPEQIGRQHGLLLRHEMQGLVRYTEDFVGPQELPAAKARARKLFLEHVPPRYLRELTALAEAAEMPLEDVLFAQWFTDLYRSFACTCYSAPTAEGRFLARNLDFPGLGYLGRYSVVLAVRPQGRRPFVSVTWPGLIGVLSGQSRDLALAVLVVHDADGAQPGLPYQLAFRQVLEDCGSVDEAQRALEHTAITVTNNLMLVDRAGEGRVLELHPDGIAARGPEADGRLIATNHFLTRKLREPRFSLTYLNSRRRLRLAREVRPAPGQPYQVEQGLQALRACAVSYTQQSMVFHPAQGVLEVAFTDRPPATDGRFVRLEAGQLLGGE